MKRNWDKLREVLQLVEDDKLVDTLLLMQSCGDEKEEAIFMGHLLLAIEGGLVAGIKVDFNPKLNEWDWGDKAPRLTLQGHDMLDSMRSRTLWALVKKKAVDLAVPISIELIKSVMKDILAKG